jgi:YegS/Rv2252/BmrU family lipid kinase
MPTARAGHATELAAQAVRDGADVVLAIGGDGTINEVANGMIGGTVPLGILPAGTANVLSMEIGLGKRVLHAAKRLHELRPMRIATGLIHAAGSEPRHFLLMAGAGLDAEIVRKVNPGLKDRIGKLAYWAAGLSRIGTPMPSLDVEISLGSFRSGFTLASRVRNYGGDLTIARTASLASDHFEVVIFEGERSLPYVKYLAGVAIGKLVGMKGVHVVKETNIRFSTEAPGGLAVQVDGELAGMLPARVEIVPDSLTLLVPPEFKG